MDLIRLPNYAVFEDINDIDDTDDIDHIDNNLCDIDLYEHPRIPRRYIRDGNDPFDFYDAEEFKRRYRFSKESVLYAILPKIERGLRKHNNRGLPIPPVMQLLICLRYYATASFQLMLGDTMSVSQPTVSRIIMRVGLLLASLMIDYIKFPRTPEDHIENHRLFNNLGQGNGGIGLPGVDGAIDCTHIKLTATKFNNVEEIYRNRKGYFSLNVQAVVGPRMEFLDIVPEWPGSAHDSRIFRTSRLYMRYVRGEFNGILVGDGGYPCLPFLMTPLRTPQTEEEMRYNEIQIRTRQIVERTFGVWKRRFPCLARGLTTKLLCSTTTVVACAVLHNLALICNDILPEEDEIVNRNEDVEELPENLQNVDGIDGFATRESLIARIFH